MQVEQVEQVDKQHCYICYDEESETNPYAKDPMPCNCRGTIVLHVSCLKTLFRNHIYNCDVCKTPFHNNYRPVPPLIIPRIVTMHENGNITYEELSDTEHGNARNVYTKDKNNLYHGQRHVYFNDKLFLSENYCHGKFHGPTITYQQHEFALETNNPNNYWRYVYYGQYKHGKKHGRHIVNINNEITEIVYNQDVSVSTILYSVDQYNAHIKKQRKEGVYYMIPADQRPK